MEESTQERQKACWYCPNCGHRALLGAEVYIVPGYRAMADVWTCRYCMCPMMKYDNYYPNDNDPED